MKNQIVILFVLLITGACQQAGKTRKQISLNGEWEIVKTDTISGMPTDFNAKIPVPGLIDMAYPKLADQDTAYDNSIYWYKKTFKVGDSDLIKLKINKAKYHTKVYVNRQFVGENTYNFTPSQFDVKPFLNSSEQENELVIAIGCRNNLPDTIIDGSDFEKLKYIPGIYDDVKIIASSYPYIANIQTVPDIVNGTVRVVAEIEKSATDQALELNYVVREAVSKKVVAEGIVKPENDQGELKLKLDFTAKLSEVNLWTPETPFLYDMEITTSGDKLNTRFGMRSFTFNPEGGAYLLNGKPYFMRGTNVCIFRFFEDQNRGLLPWDEEWAIRLHQQFKNMHWNSIRYCIGLPPERWYDIADSLGFLIQNEYPIWTGGNPENFENFYPGVTPERLANEYRTWLPEYWNHPSVVIWDAQNESVTNVTGEAINMVRKMDLSNRPWENGWAAPQSETDPIESHPYLFSRYNRNKAKPSEKGPLSDLLGSFQIPGNDSNTHTPPKNKRRYPNPIIINEYAWLWLNRNGTTTTLTDRVYATVFGENLSKEQRIYQYTRHLGMLTEYWRAHRYCAGVLHFCALGYSRPNKPRGQTSDHFIDIKNLIYEPQFVKYVKPSFAPVGLMINFWDKTVQPGKNLDIEVYAINDLYTAWNGSLKLSICKGYEAISTQVKEIGISALDRLITTSSFEMPQEKGEYQLIAEINLHGEPVKSIRDFSVE